MWERLTITLILSLATALGACDRDGQKPKTSAEKSGSASTVGSGTAANPKAPPQTGEVPPGATGGEGTTTGARNTPPPK